MTREQEMQALENRWLAQHSADAREQQRVASALSADAEMLREEAVQSVVQHLSAFGLNRNLPWQIYATRPKRFTRGPLGREPLGREPLGPLGAPSLSSLSAARLALGEPMGAQDDAVPPLLHPLDPYAGQNAGQNASGTAFCGATSAKSRCVEAASIFLLQTCTCEHLD